MNPDNCPQMTQMATDADFPVAVRPGAHLRHRRHLWISFSCFRDNQYLPARALLVDTIEGITG